jgi:hypothetical protein
MKGSKKSAPRPWLCRACGERYPAAGSQLCFLCLAARKAA